MTDILAAFEPVVEDYEVADRFKCSKTALYEEIDHLAARHTSDQVARGRLGGDIQRLVESQIANLLARQNASFNALHAIQNNHGSIIDPIPPLGDDYVGVTTGRIGGEDLGSFSEVVRVPGHSSRNIANISREAGLNSQMRPPSDGLQVNPMYPTYTRRQIDILPARAEQRNYHQLPYPPLQPMPFPTELEGNVRSIPGTNIGLQGSQIPSTPLLMYDPTETLSNNYPMSNWRSAGVQDHDWNPNNQFAGTENTWNDEADLYGSAEWINPCYEFDPFIVNGQGTT